MPASISVTITYSAERHASIERHEPARSQLSQCPEQAAERQKKRLADPEAARSSQTESIQRHCKDHDRHTCNHECRMSRRDAQQDVFRVLHHMGIPDDATRSIFG
jgi:hypothetical protein